MLFDEDMRWFGRSWGAPIYDDGVQVETPVGEPCLRCDEPIAAGDDGFIVPYLGGAKPMHRECHFRSIFGGVNHLRHTCTCYGGDQPNDPPGLSTRAAARAMLALFDETQRRRTH